MRHRPTAWAFVSMLNPYLTSRAMDSSSVALCRQDHAYIIIVAPDIRIHVPPSAARLTLLDQYESYGTQRSAIRGNSLRYLESSPLFSHKHGQHSFQQTQAESLRRFETQFSRRSTVHIMYGTTTPSLQLHYTDFHYNLPLQCHHIASGSYHLIVLTGHPSILQCRT